MAFIIGISIAVISVLASLESLGHHYSEFIDEVAIFIVLGGTLAVSVVILPWQYAGQIFRSLLSLIIPKTTTTSGVVSLALEFAKSRYYGTDFKTRLNGLSKQVLEDGQELLQLGFSKYDIENILSQRINFYTNRIYRIANAFKGVSKYPHAYRMMGTVFGLVELMKAITEGIDPSETGSRMAIALVATLYGITVANLLVGPIAETIAKSAEREEELATICLEAVLLAAEGATVLKSQELLNSFVSKRKRTSVLAQPGLSDAV